MRIRTWTTRRWQAARCRATAILSRGDEKRRATEAACRSLKALGTIAVGDICPTLLSPPFLAREPLRARIFVEVTGIGPRRGVEKLAEAIEKLRLAEDEFADAGLSFSLAPHAPYSTDASVIRSIIRENAAQGRITSFHLAESAQEVGFLTGEDDSFERAIKRWGFWEEGWRPPRMRPVAYLESLGGLAPGVMLVHCVQLLDEEIDAIAGSGCSVCLCPRSNDRIGVGRPRIREMLAAGVEPALGTDGLGSVDSLSVFDEMAFIRKALPEIEPEALLTMAEALLTMATLNGARALRFEREIGSLARGRIARFLVYRGDIGRDPADALTSGIDHMLLSWVGEGNV